MTDEELKTLKLVRSMAHSLEGLSYRLSGKQKKLAWRAISALDRLAEALAPEVDRRSDDVAKADEVLR